MDIRVIFFTMFMVPPVNEYASSISHIYIIIQEINVHDKRDLKRRRNLSLMARGSLIGGVHLSYSEIYFYVG